MSYFRNKTSPPNQKFQAYPLKLSSLPAPPLLLWYHLGLHHACPTKIQASSLSKPPTYAHPPSIHTISQQAMSVTLNLSSCSTPWTLKLSQYFSILNLSEEVPLLHSKLRRAPLPFLIKSERSPYVLFQGFSRFEIFDVFGSDAPRFSDVRPKRPDRDNLRYSCFCLQLKAWKHCWFLGCSCSSLLCLF